MHLCCSVILCLLSFLLFLSVLVCLVLRSSRNRAPFVAANPVPNAWNNCSSARVNVNRKRASKFLLMPSYNNHNSHFNNWGRARLDLVVWCRHSLAWLRSEIVCSALQPFAVNDAAFINILMRAWAAFLRQILPLPESLLPSLEWSWFIVPGEGKGTGGTGTSQC